LTVILYALLITEPCVVRDMKQKVVVTCEKCQGIMKHSLKQRDGKAESNKYREPIRMKRIFCIWSHIQKEKVKYVC